MTTKTPVRAGKYLISNAVKFACGKRRCHDLSSPVAGHGRMQGEDNGGGIGETFLAHLFERFRQADPERGGPGQGMAIAHDIVTMHHGTISAGRSCVVGHSLVPRISRATPSARGWPLPCSTRITMRWLSTSQGRSRTASEIRSPAA